MCNSCPYSSGCGCNGNSGCGCNNNNNGCGCNGNGGGLASAISNLFGTGGNDGCGCGSYDMYYAQQYALGPFSPSCGCGN